MTKKTLKRRYVPLLLAACFGAAGAAPTSPQVVAGQATFSQQGNVFSITNTPNTIIDWQSFSVNAGEVTRFMQQGADSAVLNRIVGQDPSKILGALQSNGKVFLINPNGIVFGRDARVDVNGLVASTLNISNADFLAGKKNFAAGAVAGDISNEGAITTPAGGKVYLIAQNVENSGIISSPKGEVVLAAGHSVQLVDASDPDLHVVVSAPANQALNLGQVIAQGGKIGIYGALVNQRGLINANSAVVGENGKIVLKASRDTLLEQGSVTSATGAGKGGEIHLLGERVGLLGNASVDASGALGGGSVLAGGDYQGKNPLLPNARQVWLGKDASIRADAIERGDGGKVVLWSDEATNAYGRISARGGALGGDGGQVETSGHYLDVNGIAVNTGAQKGRTGSWLLDPYDIEVVTDGAFAAIPDVAAFGSGLLSGVTKIAPSVLAAGTNVVLQAQHDLTISEAIATAYDVSAQAGHDITVNAPVSSSGGRLNFSAANNFTLGANGSLLGSGHIDLQADQIDLIGGVSADSVTLKPYSAAAAISVGGPGDQPGFSIWQGTFDRISANSLTIGGPEQQGGLTVTGTLTLSSNAPATLMLDAGDAPLTVQAPLSTTRTLMLKSTNGVFQVGDPAIVADKLGIEGGQVILGGANSIGTVAAIANGSVFHVTGTGDLHVGQVGDLAGISTAASTSVQVSTSGALVFDRAISGGAADVTLDGAGIYGSGSVAGTVLTLRSTGGIGTGTAPLNTQARVLTASNQGAGTRPINIANTGELVLDRAVQDGDGNAGAIIIDNAGGITVPANVAAADGTPDAHGIVKTGGGDISLIAHNALTINGKVAGGSGNIRLEAGNGGLLAVNAGASVSSASGDVTTVAGSTSIASGTISVSDPSKLHGLPPLTLESCIATPGQNGCAAIINQAILACSVDPNAPHCADVMPTVPVCQANPSAPGCDAVLRRYQLDQCVANPTGAGCDQILPSLQTCRVDATVYGCAPVLAARAQFDACLANPSAGGCAAVLPPLAMCKAARSQEGCTQVLQVAFSFCLAHPNDASCIGILPTLSQCVADKSLPGCSAVLPTFEQCAGSPTLQGCEVVLPTIAQCVASPSLAGCQARLPTLAQCAARPALQGCEVVLPQPDFCGAHPTDPTCQLFNPGAGSSDGKRTVQTTVGLINGSTPAGSGEKQAEKQKAPAPGENSGVKNEKPATKTYCN